MKKLFTLIILLCATNVFAQGLKIDSTGFWNGTSMNQFFTLPHPTYDTVKVVMLMIDTGVMVRAYGTPKHGVAYWEYGYVVYDRGFLFYTVNHFGDNPVYLDNKKRPLSPSVIVWMSKEIKK